MTGTARDLVTASLKRLGVVSGIETPAADLAADGLSRLNELIETWRTESLYALTRQLAIVPLVSGQKGYYLGPLGPGTVRPEEITGVNVILPGTPDYEVPLIPLSDDDWQNLTHKALTTALPTHFYYGAGYPTAQIRLWPIFAGGSATGIAVYGRMPAPDVLTLDTVLDLPNGYWRALRDGLALELAPEVGRSIDPALAQSAIEAKAQLQRANFRPRELGMPAGIVTGDWGGYDWRVK